MGRICIIGAFRLKAKPRGGQEIKTTILADEIENKYGKIRRIDTVGMLNRVLLPFKLIYAIILFKNVIILPAKNGLIVEAVLLSVLNLAFRRRLLYIVIGGWLQDFLLTHPLTSRSLKSFFGIYVETTTMLQELEGLGLTNVRLFPNFKSYNIIKNVDSNIPSIPYKLCMFSRVSFMKGTLDAVNLINRINSRNTTPIYTLDIYGPLEECDIEWFENLKQSFNSNISYRGIASFNETTHILSGYFALLFPTKYYTEGIPGTIMDAYAAGLPVISSKWKSFHDVIEDGVTGLGYEFDNLNQLEELLLDISSNPEKITSLKSNCIKKVHTYLPSSVLPILEIK